MAQLPGGQFNGQNQAPMESFEPLPPGDYVARIVESEMKPTKDNTGQYLSLIFQVMSQGFENRKIFNNLNLVNKSAKAVDIANRELGEICRAVGKPVINDSQELHGIPMLITVKIEPATERYAASNSITGYKPASGVPVPQASAAGMSAPAPQAGQGAAAPQAPAEEKPPWA